VCLYLDSRVITAILCAIILNFEPVRQPHPVPYLPGLVQCFTGQIRVGVTPKKPASVEINNTADFYILPNPTREGYFTVQYTGESAFTLSMFDLTGKLVYSGDHTTDEQINVSHLDGGFYLMKVEGSKGLSVGKIVLE